MTMEKSTNIDLEYSDDFAENLFNCELFSDNQVAKSFRILYPAWNKFNSFLPISVWREINETKTISKDVFSDFIKHIVYPDTSILSQWHYMTDLDDDQFQQLLVKTEKEFNNPTSQSIEDITVFIQYVCIAFEKGVTKWNDSQMITFLSNYIDVTMNHIIGQTTIDYDKFYDLSKFVQDKTIPNDSKESIFCIMKKRLLEKIKDYYRASLDRLFEDLLNQIEYPNTFESWFFQNNIIHTDIFSFKEPQRLWDKIKGLPTKDFKNVQENLRARIVNSIFDKEKQKPEIEFWEKYMDIMKHDKDEWEKESKNIWKCDYVNVFIELVKNAFDEIEQPKIVKKI